METIRKATDFFLDRLFLLYVVFAGIATVVDFGVLTALVELGGMHYLASAAVSYLCGMLTNFSLNKFFNFKNRSTRVVGQFGLFAVVALVGLGLNQLILYGLVEHAHVHYLAAKAISVAVVMFWSFIGHKKLTFAVFK